MRIVLAAMLILAASSCGDTKKTAGGAASHSGTSNSAGKSAGDKPEVAMKDTTVTVDIGYKGGPITLTIPAGWTRASADTEKHYGPTWYAPDKPAVISFRPSFSLGRDQANEGETAEQHHKRRMEEDKKFAGAAHSGDELMDPENKVGRKLTPLAFEGFPGGWLWAYQVTYEKENDFDPTFGITIWRYAPGDTDFVQFAATGHLQYKDKYYDKLVEIGKTMKIGK